jgi:hypothetical protein
VRRTIKFTVIAISALLTNLSANAADVRMSNTVGCAIDFVGPVVAGDFERVVSVAKSQKMLRTEFDDVPPKYLCLNSAGGSFIEGLKISELLIKHAVGTKVLRNSICYSSCANIFMAGTSRGEDWDNPDRILQVGGKLGFHAPFLSLNEVGGFSAKEIEQVFDGANRLSSLFARMFSYRSLFFSDQWMRGSLVHEMFDTERDKLIYVDTVDRAGRWQIAVEGIKMPQVLLRNIVQACENFQSWVHDQSSKDARADISIYMRNNKPDKDGFYFIDTGGMSARNCKVRWQKNRVQICSVDDFKSIHHGSCPDSPMSYPLYYLLSPTARLDSLR